ncbi:hypothetical protein [Aquimarina celericrescens]|uniref:Anti-sigma factor n=1 Tax=Aquimarina celericrescens TaxID=1964542 RepID=A0ABW5B5B9_9FLAO|nr:hypothetical protein [Aquimarina celericrescens]
MAPLKFEDKIKEKLEQRAIHPSEGSWEKLSSQLEDTEGHKEGNKKIWWYSIAAVFVGVLILTSVFSDRPASNKMYPQIVDRSKEEVKQNDIEIVQKNDKQQKSSEEKINRTINNEKNGDRVVINSKEEEKILSQKDKINLQKFIAKDTNVNEKNAITDVFQNDQVDSNSLTREDILPISSEVIKDKVEGVVAQIEELQKNNTQVTDEEIDNLLREAQRDITTQEIIKYNTVSASALLQDVEEEIDETFKQRVFEALKSGFQKVKTAVAEREN